jgi:hypothetical protein
MVMLKRDKVFVGSRVRDVEKKFQKPLEDCVYEALIQSGTVNEAAIYLGVNKQTFYSWVRRLGYTLPRVVLRPGERVEIVSD